MSSTSDRDGFALLAVLWLLVWVSVLGIPMLLRGREMQDVTANRVSLARARWTADGCVERALAAAGEAMREPAAADSTWNLLDLVLRAAPLTADCDLTTRPAGITADVNMPDAARLGLVLRAAGVRGARADSLVDALGDWRDADDEPRPFGCERACAESRNGIAPRNAAIASRAELHAVPGLSDVPGVDTLLGVETGRLLLARAPAAVFLSLPGASPSVAAAVTVLRHARTGVTVPSIAMRLPQGERAAWLARSAELSGLVTATPDAWVITVRASAGVPAMQATHEVGVARSGGRLGILWRRSLP